MADEYRQRKSRNRKKRLKNIDLETTNGGSEENNDIDLEVIEKGGSGEEIECNEDGSIRSDIQHGVYLIDSPDFDSEKDAISNELIDDDDSSLIKKDADLKTPPKTEEVDPEPKGNHPQKESVEETKETDMEKQLRNEFLKSMEEIGELELQGEGLETIDKEKQYLDQIATNEVNEEVKVDNIRVLSKSAKSYELENFEKNAMLIFNHLKIDGYEDRLGTDKDVTALKNTFGRFGFEVEDHTDLTKQAIFSELKKFSERDFTNVGCICVAVLTHGTFHGVLRAKDMTYSELDILEYFNVEHKPRLRTKPIILIIQACRGTKASPALHISSSAMVKKDVVVEEAEPYYLPVGCDTLVIHSSYRGGTAYRHELRGSWFIQSLCKNINLHSSLDLESILMIVKKDVAHNSEVTEFDKKQDKMAVFKQMPVITSTLINKLYLKKFDASPKCKDSQLAICQEIDFDSSDMNHNHNHNHQSTCLCYLRYFEYLKKCLRYYLEVNPTDVTAQNYLQMSNLYTDSPSFNASKEFLGEIICKFLKTNAQSYDFYKYLYFTGIPSSPGV